MDKEYYKKLYDLKSWQGLHVNQLGYLRNLVLILSTASLGFTVNLLVDKKVIECRETTCIKVSCFFLLASIFAGIVMAILESKNYRLKYKIGRMIEKSGDFNELPDDIDKQQQRCSRLERMNRVLLYFEAILFLVAILIITVTVL